jgi:protein SCO1
MNTVETLTRTERLLGRLSVFFKEGGFPIFALSALFFYQIFVAVTVFWPSSSSVWGAFAEEFRIRCFQYDPKTGWLQWSQVLTMISEPALLQAIVILVWRKTLIDIWQRRRRTIFQPTATALVVVGLMAGSLFGIGGTATPQPEFPFPGERIRTQLPMPAFSLTDQNGQTVSNEDYKGRVVLVSAVYSACTTTCPLILMQMRQILHQLSPEEQNELAIIVVSLNPEQDTTELRSSTVQQYYGGRDSNVHFLNGAPEEVESLLDKLQIVRSLNPETGKIEHANLFFVLDREGRIAYRLSLSERHEFWLIEALRSVLADQKSS